MTKIYDIEDLHLQQRFDDGELDHRLIPYGYNLDQANEIYAYKSAAIQKAISARDWETYIWLHESPYRFEVLLEVLRLHDLSPEEAWPLVGLVWCGTERAWHDREEWQKLWLSQCPHRHLVMDEEERTRLDGLPSELIVWRGTNYRETVRGFSWTLNRDVAVRFARRDSGPLLLVRGRVRKARVIAYLNGRKEEEIVAAPQNVYRIEVEQLQKK